MLHANFALCLYAVGIFWNSLKSLLAINSLMQHRQFSDSLSQVSSSSIELLFIDHSLCWHLFNNDTIGQSYQSLVWEQRQAKISGSRMPRSTCYHPCWVATYFVIQSGYHVTVSYFDNMFFVFFTKTCTFRTDFYDYKCIFNGSLKSPFPPGERPFSCPHCNRAFADRSNLRAHLQTHADVKKYQCNTCSRTFSRMSLLQKHSAAGCCPSTAWGHQETFYSTSGLGALWDDNNDRVLLSTPAHICNMQQYAS